nr:hypothetical protein Q903MT_gene1551 [Picea sitchensis]
MEIEVNESALECLRDGGRRNKRAASPRIGPTIDYTLRHTRQLRAASTRIGPMITPCITQGSSARRRQYKWTTLEQKETHGRITLFHTGRTFKKSHI